MANSTSAYPASSALTSGNMCWQALQQQKKAGEEGEAERRRLQGMIDGADARMEELDRLRTADKVHRSEVDSHKVIWAT